MINQNEVIRLLDELANVISTLEQLCEECDNDGNDYDVLKYEGKISAYKTAREMIRIAASPASDQKG